MAAYKERLDAIIVLSLCVMIFVLPFSKSALEVSFITAFAAFVLKRILSYGPASKLPGILKPAYTKLNLPIYLFVMAGAASTFYSASLSLSLKGFFFKLLEGVFLYFIIAETINNKNRLNLILTSMILSMTLTGIDGIFQRITGWDFIRHHRLVGWDLQPGNNLYLKRVSASFINPNGLGGWLTIMIPLIFGIAAMDKKQIPGVATKPFAWALAGILTACFILTLSKGAFIGLGFGGIFFAAVIFFIKFHKTKVFLIIIALIITAILLVSACLVNIYPVLTEFFARSIRVNSWANALSLARDFLFSVKRNIVSVMLEKDIVRTNLWREAIQITKRFPAFGCGLNTYSIVAPHYKSGEREGGVYPHNSYLQMTAEMGIIGLASFMWIIFALFNTSLRSIGKIKDRYYAFILIGLTTGLFGFLAHSFFDVNFYALQLANLMWFVMGLIIAVQKTALGNNE